MDASGKEIRRQGGAVIFKYLALAEYRPQI
jgi:hypothetical protein